MKCRLQARPKQPGRPSRPGDHGDPASLPAAPVKADGAAALTGAEYIDRLRTLRKLLASDDGDAAEFMAKLAPSLANVLTDEEVQNLTRTIGNFDFPSALATLDDVCRRLSLEMA